MDYGSRFEVCRLMLAFRVENFVRVLNFNKVSVFNFLLRFLFSFSLSLSLFINFYFVSRFLFFLILLFSFNISFSQSYFQQHVAYKIDVTLDDKKHLLTGFETLVYTNNSPTTLNEIYLHLYPNAYKNNSTALAKEFLDDGNLSFQNANDSLKGFMDELNFRVDDSIVRTENDVANIDIRKIILNKPVEPGMSITITTPFKVKIPDARFSRLGHTKQAYYISQWYPKPAVFDKTGWHPMPNLSQGEFYGEYGSFIVNITLPANYVVGATGVLQNDSEIKWLEQKSEETKQIKFFEKDLSFPESSPNVKTITYKQDSIHDFAWFADKRFHVLKSEMTLPHSKRKVTTYAMFTNLEAHLWKQSPQYINDAIYYYSLWNGDYPYTVCTAIDGVISAGGGMEYPMVTVIGRSSNDFNLEDVIVHEVGHNWFYGILGTNEREFAWMDEGINIFNEQRYFLTKYNNEGGNALSSALPFSGITGLDALNFKQANMVETMLSIRNFNDQSLTTPAKDFTNLNYGVLVYGKTGVLFEYLKNYLTDTVFDRCMKKYFETWKFKHPYPDDLRKIFETETGKNLDWFFDDLIGTTKKTDYAITRIKSLKNENDLSASSKVYSIEIKNKQQAAIPFSISTINNNKATSTTWHNGFLKNKKINIICGNCDKIAINYSGEMPDINNSNNTIKTKGILKKFEPVSLKMFPRIENTNQSQLFLTPVVGYNAHNGIMAGISFSNYFIEKKNFEYSITPLYGIDSKTIAGVSNFNYTYFFNESFLHNINFNFNPRYFAYLNDKIRMPDNSLVDQTFNYYSLPVSIKFAQRKKIVTDVVQHSLKLKNIFTGYEQYNYAGVTPGTQTKYRNTIQAIAVQENKNKLDPHEISLMIESGKQYVKTSVELIKKFSYARVRKGIELRFFGGTFLYDESEGTSSFKMSGWSGRNDYLFNDFYFARNDADNFLNQQMVIRDGGLKAYAPGATSNKWLIAINASIKLPGLPIKFFGDAGTYANAKNAYQGSEPLVYNAGISISLINNFCEIYFPFIVSKDIKSYQETNDFKFSDKIRFVFNIKSLNLLNLRKQLLASY